MESKHFVLASALLTTSAIVLGQSQPSTLPENQPFERVFQVNEIKIDGWCDASSTVDFETPLHADDFRKECNRSYKQKNYWDMIGHCGRCLILESDSSACYRGLVVAFAKLKKFDMAKICYVKYERSLPKNESTTEPNRQLQIYDGPGFLNPYNRESEEILRRLEKEIVRE